MADPKDIFASAFLCERILTEGKIHSAIRIVDIFTLRMPENIDPSKTITLPFEINLFVRIKSEAPRDGEVWIALEGLAPDRKELGRFGPFKVSLKGDGHGHHLKLPVFLNIGLAEGLYWFNVFWGDELIQRTPMRLRHERQSADQPDRSQNPTQTSEGSPTHEDQ